LKAIWKPCRENDQISLELGQANERGTTSRKEIENLLARIADLERERKGKKRKN